MTIKQISVFLENKSGRLNEVARVLAANQINMLAFCIAETTDFGLMRLIVKEVDKAVEVLRNAGFAVILPFTVPTSLDHYPRFWRVWLKSIFLSSTCMRLHSQRGLM